MVFHPFENVEPFLSAKGAFGGAKCLYCTEWIALPHFVKGGKVSKQGGGRVWEVDGLLVEMFGIGVGCFACSLVRSNILEVLSHACLEMLLGGSHIKFLGDSIFHTIHNAHVSAHVGAVAACGCFVSAVAFQVLKIPRGPSLVEFLFKVCVE